MKEDKIIKKSDGSSTSVEDSQIEGKLAVNSSDVEIKYKLHLCYMNTNQVKLHKALSFSRNFEIFGFKDLIATSFSNIFLMGDK